MRCIKFLVILLLVSVELVAQQNHFIYIQTEQNQPFYVRMGSRVLSSSTAGYMVISKLQDGVHDLYIGFPKNEWPQQKLTVNIRNNDAGYVLKNFDTKGWGLFNMQTMEVIMPSAGQKKTEPAANAQPDGFADVLADVVNNPSIRQKPVTAEPEKEKAVKETKEPETPVKDAVVIKAEETPVMVKQPVPEKVFSVLEAGGRTSVYVVRYADKTDTVRVYIPYTVQGKEKAVKADEPKADVVEEKKEKPVERKEVMESENKQVVSEKANPSGEKVDTVKTEPLVEKREEPVKGNDNVVVPVKQEVVMINSDCRSNATEDDFLKLRKKMAAQKSDENMIVVAKKSFVTKCYTTEQVRNLSLLFLKDEGCYAFFDAAYPHVNDTQNFGSLISRLTDEYYRNRFKAMIRH